MRQLQETLPEEQEERIAVFDSGGYSQANMKRYNEAQIKWISRVEDDFYRGEKGAPRGVDAMAGVVRWVRKI
jgi:hypothetical protein